MKPESIIEFRKLIRENVFFDCKDIQNKEDLEHAMKDAFSHTKNQPTKNQYLLAEQEILEQRALSDWNNEEIEEEEGTTEIIPHAQEKTKAIREHKGIRKHKPIIKRKRRGSHAPRKRRRERTRKKRRKQRRRRKEIRKRRTYRFIKRKHKKIKKEKEVKENE